MPTIKPSSLPSGAGAGNAVLALCLLPIVLLAPACANRAGGGSAQREIASATAGEGSTASAQGNVVVTVNGDDIRVERTSASSATTQPATTSDSRREATQQGEAVSYTGALPQLGSVDAGAIAGAWLEAAPKTVGANWPMFLLFALAAAGCWYFGARLWAVACGGLAIVALWQPWLVGMLALAAVAIAGWHAWRAWRQTVKGIERAKTEAPEAIAPVLAALSAEQDQSTKAAVKLAK